MAGGWRREAARSRLLRALLRDTVRALRDLKDILHFDPEISTAVQEIGNLASRPTALVLLGTSAAARARLLHCLIGRRLLPDPMPRGCRWLRIQYGSATQVHLTLGNSEFELVEDLECNKQPWDTLPIQDLIRQDQTDLSTILEVELNVSFLKDGLRIIIPPDIDTPSEAASYLSLKQAHSELYKKREAILKNFNPVYLYAMDKMGCHIFCDTVSDEKVVDNIEEDFWNTYNLYYMARGKCDSVDSDKCDVRVDLGGEEGGESSVFSAENYLDLHQIKELDPQAQLLFVLFSDSVSKEDRRGGDEGSGCKEATESAESVGPYQSEQLPESDRDMEHQLLRQEHPEHSEAPNRRLHEEQMAFMNDLLDQWDLISRPPPKHHVKSQWLILDDLEILQAAARTNMSDANQSYTHVKRKRDRDSDRCVKSLNVFLNAVLKFATECSQSYLLKNCTKLSEVHVKLVQQFILASFDMARELQVVPKKIKYVAQQEQQLYETITEKFSEGDKKQELVQIMQEVLREMNEEINLMDWTVDDLPCHLDQRFLISNSVLYSQRDPSVSIDMNSNDRNGGRVGRTDDKRGDGDDRGDSDDRRESDAEEAVSYDSYNFDDYEIIGSSEPSLYISDCYSRTRSAEDPSLTSQVDLIRVENEMFSLSQSSQSWRLALLDSSVSNATTCTNTANISIKQASLDVQQTVLSELSRKISLKLVNFVDCLKESYFGTLQRCVESLERACLAELRGRPVSAAARQLLAAARRADLRPAADTALRQLLDQLRQLLARLRAGGGAAPACCPLSPRWRRRAARRALRALCPLRLARAVSEQILERLSVAHEKYQSALTALETALASRLHHTEDVKLAIRKKYAPCFARLCLESTSMCDLLMYGTPELGREIGRGQYGVVYAVRGAWGGCSPAAVKSVLPADERHYHELAMEFFYTRSIPPHPRVVRLLGSLVRRGGGAAPGVLLLSPRYARDLHAAVRAGLSFAKRMRIACDIVEGIRYLHSLGLVHRDVKLKNVLLDARDRAALADLGFCAAAALLSGSVVGTPVHMAPELLAGRYRAAVDVYAFGILFWYVCAGNIKLPAAFEAYQKKEQLWSKVKRGLRPERLPHFSDECWDVMQSCWATEPSERALLGDVQPRLEAILERALQVNETEPCPGNKGQDGSDDETLYMTGLDAKD